MRIVVSVALALVVSGTLSEVPGQDTPAVVTGHVNDMRMHSIQALIQLKGSQVQSLTDSTGHFVLRGLPSGRFVLVSEAVGYAKDYRELTVSAGDSVHVGIRLYPAAIPFPGNGLSPPPDSLIALGESLLPRVLNTNRVRELIERNVLQHDTLRIWVPWAARLPDSVAASGGPILITKTCEACVGAERLTVAGDLQYQSAIQHLRVAVMLEPAEMTVLTFCVDRAPVGRYMSRNCTGIGYTKSASFTLQRSGTWLETTEVDRWP